MTQEPDRTTCWRCQGTGKVDDKIMMPWTGMATDPIIQYEKELALINPMNCPDCDGTGIRRKAAAI